MYPVKPPIISPIINPIITYLSFFIIPPMSHKSHKSGILSFFFINLSIIFFNYWLVKDMSSEIYEFVIVDSKGRIIIPSRIRRILNISDGMMMMMIADPDKREIKIIPLADLHARIYRLKIEMTDKPGVLAKVASLLAKNSIDLLMTESRTIKRGEIAQWNVIADFSSCKLNIKELVDMIEKLDFIRRIDIREIL
ncbi:hypothetical protein DRN87_03270 [Candidatus Geothermarchaeota archaeon]|nr:MAG: hypothetical protein DRN87_03270 [Candidatus Geothermarchaeota archaeon]